MTGRNPRHLAAGHDEFGGPDAFASLVNRSQRPRFDLEEVRQHWQHDVDHWHQEVRGLRVRAKVAVGIGVAVAAAGVAALVLAAERADPPVCVPPPAAAGHNVTAGDAG
jgi:hypothetical protein